MRRSLAVSVVILGNLAANQAFGQVSKTLKAKLDSIIQSQKEAQELYQIELRGESDPKAQKAAVERYREAVKQNMGEILKLARAHPKASANVDALGFVIRTAKAGPGDESEQAIEILLHDHVREPGMGKLCGAIFYFIQTPLAESLLRAVLDQNPNREDRGRACHTLALYLNYKAQTVRRVREQPAVIDRYASDRLKPVAQRLFEAADPERLEKESESLLERIGREFADVEDDFDHRPLGKIAAGELFAMRNLSVGKVAPEISGEDEAGKPFSLSDYRGKVVVLTFSGNWCGPCVGMYPQERELVTKLKDQPFAIVSVNTDENVDSLKKSINTGEINWRCFYDSGVTGPITTAWGVRSFPTIFVLDKAGVIRFKDLRGDKLDQAVHTLLDETKSADRAR
jgi:peroxiredoxin